MSKAKKISEITFSSHNPTDGMPRHPTYTHMPIMWAEENDQWLFRKITAPLIPRAVRNALGDKYDEEAYIKSLGNPKNPIVRFACAAVERAPSHGGGVDFVLWAEEETLNPEKNTSTVQLTTNFGPSHFASRKDLDDNMDIINKAFVFQYENGEWLDALFDVTKAEE